MYFGGSRIGIRTSQCMFRSCVWVICQRGDSPRLRRCTVPTSQWLHHIQTSSSHKKTILIGDTYKAFENNSTIWNDEPEIDESRSARTHRSCEKYVHHWISVWIEKRKTFVGGMWMNSIVCHREQFLFVSNPNEKHVVEFDLLCLATFKAK